MLCSLVKPNDTFRAFGEKVLPLRVFKDAILVIHLLGLDDVGVFSAASIS